MIEPRFQSNIFSIYNICPLFSCSMDIIESWHIITRSECGRYGEKYTKDREEKDFCSHIFKKEKNKT